MIRARPLLWLAVAALALLPVAAPAQQIASIEKRNAAKNAEYRDDFLHRDPLKRRKAATPKDPKNIATISNRTEGTRIRAIQRLTRQVGAPLWANCSGMVTSGSVRLHTTREPPAMIDRAMIHRTSPARLRNNMG